MRGGKKGLTLIEIIISFALLSIILLTVFTMSAFVMKENRHQADVLKDGQVLRESLDLIEKRLREMNRYAVTYLPEEKTFQCVMKVPESNQPVTVRVDLSGKTRSAHHTWVYFNRNTSSLMVNKKGEHNVLSREIADLDVKEIVPGRLFEISLTGTHSEQPLSFIFSLPEKRDDA